MARAKSAGLAALAIVVVVAAALAGGGNGRLQRSVAAGTGAGGVNGRVLGSRRVGPALWLAGADGSVSSYGRAAYVGKARTHGSPIVAMGATRTGRGYWLASADGRVAAVGDARRLGAVPARPEHAPIVALAATASGRGYLLAGADGAVYAFGDALFRGTIAGLHLNGPVSAMAPTPSGKGYWLVATDGAMFAFGDARLFGDSAHLHLGAPVVSIAATPTGNGYWLASADGALYPFGDARKLPGTSGPVLTDGGSPALAGANATVSANGDGGVTGGAGSGAVAGRSRRPDAVTAIARTSSGRGYWLITSNGRISSFGDAPYLDSTGPRPTSAIAAIAIGVGTVVPVTPTAPSAPTGFDISWPQCGGRYPAPSYGFGVVGVTGGQLFTANPCLRDEWRWARAHGSFAGLYVNTNSFTDDQRATFLAAAGRSCQGDVNCALYRWGRQGAAQALVLAGDLPAPRWWLDVETANHWGARSEDNVAVLQGIVDELTAAGKKLGVYSTSQQWGEIAGQYSPALPVWVAGAPDLEPGAYCEGHGFGGGRAWMVQASSGVFDVDVLCKPGSAGYGQTFARPDALVALEDPDPAAPPAPAPSAGQSLGTQRRSLPLPSPDAVGTFQAAGPSRPWRGQNWAWLGLAAVLLVAVGVVGERTMGRAQRPPGWREGDPARPPSPDVGHRAEVPTPAAGPIESHSRP